MTLTFLTDHTSPQMHALSEQVVDDWNTRRPDAPVQLAVADHEDLRDQLADLLTAAVPPDVMTWFAGHRMRAFTDHGLVHDLTNLWQDKTFAEHYPPELRRLAGTRFLPTTRYWWAMYYRPSVFASVGINTSVRTWDELSAAVAAFRAAGIAPIALGARHRCPAAAWFDYLDMRLNGPEFHQDLMELRASYTDPRVLRVFDTWRRLLDEDWFLGEPAEYDEQDAVDAVLAGRAGMTFIGAYVSDEHVGPDEQDLDFFRFPVLDPRLPVGEDTPIDGYFLPGRGKQLGHAAGFLAYLGSHEVQQRTVAALTVLPTRDDVSLDHASELVRKGARLVSAADHVTQFYDLDTPWELADTGMAAFLSFLREPAGVASELRTVDELRAALATDLLTSKGI